MTIKLGTLNYVDLILIPKTDNMELSRFYARMFDIHNKMAGRVNEDDRVVTYGDLKTLGLI